MYKHTTLDALLRYVNASFPILYINTFETTKADKLIEEAARKAERVEVLEWDGTGRILDFHTKSSLMDTTLPAVLSQFASDSNRKFLVLKDIHTYMEQDPMVLSLLRDIAIRISTGRTEATLIIVSPVLQIPKELEKYITVLEIDYLSTEEIRGIIHTFAENYELTIQPKLLDEMSTAFKGLSELEVENILSLAYADDGELSRNDLDLIFEQKQQMIKKAGILEMIPRKEGLDDIGGLENLKEWLRRKARVYKNMEQAKSFGVDMPKGVLIAGVPGCGKSLNAKAAAKLFEVPLLRLDMGRLMGKYVGESEANMRNAIHLAEAISPCVLWIDELEKAFAGSGGDGGGAEVTTRLLGSFLTWLQEKESPTFVVATANDVTKLPPELLRKGRFDEVFYVGLPNDAERKKIFEIHIAKRRSCDLASIDLPKLVAQTKGYSGADIEGAVKEAIESVFANGRSALTTDDLLSSIKQTPSLSEIMHEQLEKMNKEYQNRKFRNASN